MFKVLRALFLIFLLLVVTLCAGIWWLSNNANHTIKEQIEIQGTQALGTAVTVGSVDLNLRGTGIKINNLKVANLPGYSTENILTADQIAVSVTRKSFFNKLVEINHVIIDGANVYAELKNNRINLNDLKNKLNASNNTASSSGETSEANNALKDVRIRLNDFKFKNGNMHLLSNKYGSADVPAPYIQLRNIGGSEGLPVEQFTDALLNPLIDQLKVAGKELIYSELELRVKQKLRAETIRIEMKLKEKEKEVKKKYEAELKAKEGELKDKLKEKEDELKNKLEDKLKGLL